MASDDRDPNPDRPLRVSFPRHVWVIAVVVIVTQLGVFGAQIALLEDQRSTVDRQLATAAKQLELAAPVLEDARPVVRATREQLPQTRRLTRRALDLTEELTPLARDLRRGRADEQLEAAGALARTLLDADLPRAARGLIEATDELGRQQRLRRLLVRANAVLGEARARDLVAKAARAAEATSEQISPTVRETLVVQRRLLAVQIEALAAIQQTLAVARETERHAESIDRKTGGPVAGGSPAGR